MAFYNLIQLQRADRFCEIHPFPGPVISPALRLSTRVISDGRSIGRHFCGYQCFLVLGLLAEIRYLLINGKYNKPEQQAFRFSAERSHHIEIET